MKLVYVDDPPAQGGRELRLVKLPAGFGCDELWYGETPVTEGQWVEVMGGKMERGESFPKVNVSFIEANEFCNRISQSTGMGVRLPTEVEQCRGLGEEPGADELEKYAVFAQQKIQPVKTRLPNEFGLYDVRGLVWEWAEIERDYKSLRGGSWLNAQLLARAVYGDNFRPGIRNDLTGFRVVVSRPPSD